MLYCGERLFRWPIPDNIAATSGCISYEIGGKQYIAIAVGWFSSK